MRISFVDDIDRHSVSILFCSRKSFSNAAACGFSAANLSPSFLIGSSSYSAVATGGMFGGSLNCSDVFVLGALCWFIVLLCEKRLLILRLLIPNRRRCSECGLPLRGPRRSKQPPKAESTNYAFINLRINSRFVVRKENLGFVRGAG